MKSKTIQYMSYALGALGYDTLYVTLSTYFMILVTSQMSVRTDKATNIKMIAIVTSLVIGICLVEIIFDPLIGGVIDNTRTKYGKLRLWLVIGDIVSFVLLVAISTNFSGLATHNTILLTILFAIVFILLDSFYSFRDIAFWLMIPASSMETKECEKFTTFARFGSSLGANGITLVVVPIVTFFTYLVTHKHIEGASGWFWFGVIVVIIPGGTAIITALGTKEVDTAARQQNEKAGIKDMFKAVAQNNQLMWLALAYIVYAIANVVMTIVLFCFFKYVLGQPTEFWIVGLVVALLGLVAVPLFLMLTRVISRRYVYLGGIAMMIPSYFFFAIVGSSLSIVITGLVLLYLPQQLIFLSVLMTIIDSVEHGQWKDGIRNEAVTPSVRPLLDRIAGTLSNGIVGFVAIASGMTGNAAAADITIHGVATLKAYVLYAPVALMIFSVTIFVWKITLTEKEYAQVVEELENELAPADTVEDEPHDAVVPSH